MRMVLITLILLFSTEVFAELIQVPPLRNSNSAGVVGDLQSRTLSGYGNENSAVSRGHYGTHGTNSRIRNQYGRGAAYLLKGNACLITDPPVTLRDIYNSAGSDIGPSANDYLIISARWWNNQPTFLADEVTAYTNGTLAGIENGDLNDAKFSLYRAMELFTYMRHLQRLSNNPADLNEFMELQQTRLLIIYNYFKEEGWAQDRMRRYEPAINY